MTTNVITTNDLTKVYSVRDGADVTAVENINLDIKEGEFVSIIGPSGCGKTTFLRLLSGLLEPSSGAVWVNGKQINEPISDVGYVFQSPLLLDWRTSRENTMLPYEALEDAGTITKDRSYYEERADSLLEMVGLGEFKNSYPDQLSGGMQQRAAICRALLPDPAILLMDEPFGALDEFTRDTLNQELQRIHRDTGKTVVFITHNISEAVFLSDRVVVFSSQPGQVEADVSIDLDRPRTLKMREDEEFVQYLSLLRSKITAI